MTKSRLKNGAEPAHGGKRKGAGRKPGPAKAALKKVQANHADTAEACFKLVVAMAKDKKTSAYVRLQAAIYVCDRVWGKPKQAIELPGAPIIRLILSPPATEPPPGVGTKRP